MVFGASCYIKKGKTIMLRLDLQVASLKSAAASKIRSIRPMPKPLLLLLLEEHWSEFVQIITPIDPGMSSRALFECRFKAMLSQHLYRRL